MGIKRGKARQGLRGSSVGGVRRKAEAGCPGRNGLALVWKQARRGKGVIRMISDMASRLYLTCD